MSLSRYYHSIRPLRFNQICWRLINTARRRSSLALHPPASSQVRWILPVKKRASFIWPPVGRQTDLRERTFDLLNEAVTFADALDWKATGKPRLWGYNLHYFDYLSSSDASIGMQLIQDWIERCCDGIGWESAPTSYRIINWVKFADERLSPDSDERFLLKLASSIDLQANWLARNLEWEVDGNHLLKNAVALLFAGQFLGENRYLQKGKSLLRRTVEEQILPDGAHCERSPMYHSIVLMDILDAANLDLQDEPFRQLLLDAAASALGFLRGMTHADGRISLFNDSDFGVAPDPEDISSYAEVVSEQLRENEPRASSVAFPIAGYYTLAANRWRMLVDAGEVCPGHLPAHAHCDMLSYELSSGNCRAVVDSGNYDYCESGMREYCRSTRAHNTSVVDGQEQSDVWKIFRVGRRAQPGPVQWLPGHDASFLHASHDGYGKKLGVIHERTFIAYLQGFYLIMDRFIGTGSHQVESYIHLHPDCSLANKGDRIVVTLDKRLFAICSLFPEGRSSVEQGWYCPEFGMRRRQEVLVFRSQGTLPLTIAYCIGDVPDGPMRLDLERSTLFAGKQEFPLKPKSA